jgi:hypothetical protein
LASVLLQPAWLPLLSLPSNSSGPGPEVSDWIRTLPAMVRSPSMLDQEDGVLSIVEAELI